MALMILANRFQQQGFWSGLRCPPLQGLSWEGNLRGDTVLPSMFPS